MCLEDGENSGFSSSVSEMVILRARFAVEVKPGGSERGGRRRAEVSGDGGNEMRSSRFEQLGQQGDGAEG